MNPNGREGHSLLHNGHVHWREVHNLGQLKRAHLTTETLHHTVQDHFLRVFGLPRINTLLAFTVAGYNYRRMAAYYRGHELNDPNSHEAILIESASAAASRPIGETATPSQSIMNGTDPPC